MKKRYWSRKFKRERKKMSCPNCRAHENSYHYKHRLKLNTYFLHDVVKIKTKPIQWYCRNCYTWFKSNGEIISERDSIVVLHQCGAITRFTKDGVPIIWSDPKYDWQLEAVKEIKQILRSVA